MSIVLLWCATFATYLVLAGQVSWHEVATGIVLASLATGWARLIRHASQLRFRLTRELLRPLGRALGQLFPATIATGVVLLRIAAAGGRAGQAYDHNFAYGAHEGVARQSVERARRAFAVLLASIAPDRFVANIDRRSGTALIHAIVQHKQEPDPRWLI